MTKTITLMAVAIALTCATQAQDRKQADLTKQCADQFKAADINNDGALTTSEIGNSKAMLPQGLQGKNRITQAEFMAACQRRS